jgi:uncharacterized protein YqeY
MALLDTLNTDLKTAMKARDEVRVATVRLLVSEVRNERIAKGRDLTEADELDVLSRAAKRRRESIEAYGKAGRDDLAAQERAELAVIEGYLPKALTPDEVRAIVREVASEVGATSARDIGKLMGALMPRLKGRFPGKDVKPIVDEVFGGS